MTLNISSRLFLFSSLSELWARRDWAQSRNRNLNPAPPRPNHNYAFAFPLLSQDRKMIKRSLAVSKIGFCRRLESFQQQDHKNPPPLLPYRDCVRLNIYSCTSRKLLYARIQKNFPEVIEITVTTQIFLIFTLCSDFLTLNVPFIVMFPLQEV